MRQEDIVYILIKEFLSILDKQEESDSGRLFHPNQISSVRIMDGTRIGEILTELKERTGYIDFEGLNNETSA